jgi:hypothetical protein
MLSLNPDAEDDAVGSGSNPTVPHGRAETVHEIVQHVGRECGSLKVRLNVPFFDSPKALATFTPCLTRPRNTDN